MPTDTGNRGLTDAANSCVNRRSLLVAVGFCVAAALALAAAWWTANEDARDLRALPSGERTQIFGRTLQNLRALCDPAPPRSLRYYCRDQAAFILKFPECDDGCQDIARRHLTQPRH